MNKLVKLFILLLSLAGLGLWGGSANAATCTSTATGGNWNAVGTWTGCTGTPGSNDTAVIATAGANVVTANVNITVGKVVINSGKLNVGGSNWTVNGATTVNNSGTIDQTATGGSATFIGLVTVNGGGTWASTANESCTFNGGITNYGTFNSGTGNYTFDTNNQAIAGTITINAVRVNSGVTLTNNGTLTIPTSLTTSTGSGTLLNTGTLNIGGTNTITTLTATTAGNTVNYYGAAQTIKPTTYYNLTLSGSSTKIMPAAATVIGNFTISGGVSVTAGAALTVGGNWIEAGAFDPGSQTVTLNGANAQTISGTSTVNFYNLNVTNGATPNITLTSNVLVANTLTGTVTLTSTCPTDYTLTSKSPAQTLHSCVAPIAEYRFDETSGSTATDSSGNGLSGTLNGGVTVGGAGKVCRGYNFNGSNAFVSVPTAALLNQRNVTVMAWMRHSTESIKSWEAIVSKGDSAYRLHLYSGGICSINGVNTAGGLSLGINGGCAGADINSGTVPVAGTWYHVAGTYDGSTIKIYVNGNVSASRAYSGAINSNNFPLHIGANAEQTGRLFSGDIDEVKIYSSALTAPQISAGYANENAGKNWDGTARPCAAAGPDHYELSLPDTSISCLPTTVTVTACADGSNPCTKVATGTPGTVNLTTTGGTIGAATLTDGVGTTTLSYPGAADSTAVTVSLTSASTAATNPATCLGGSCATTFNTAGLIFSTARDAVAATIPTQVAGVPSATYFLRAVKTDTATKACETALTGQRSVDLGYECKDPTACYAANLMSVNGSETGDGGWGAATTIVRNNDGSHASTGPVKVTFDSNGTAPLTFVYGDVGRVTLWASTTANSAVLTGSTLPAGGYLVKPHDFGVVPCAATVVGACTTPPSDPGLTGSGSVFAAAGKGFKATITARTSGGLTTPSFGAGSNNATETVTLTHTRVAPTSASAVDGALGGTTSSPRNGFPGGVLTFSDLTWSEVGVITLTATNNAFLGSTMSTTGNTGNLGRFIPDHFDTTAIGPLSCPTGLCTSPVSTMSYSGQPFGVTVTAKNAFDDKTQNYQGTFAKGVALSPVASNGGTLIESASPGGTLSANTLAAADFAAGVNTVTPASPVFKFTTVPTTPTDVYIRAEDLDVVSSLRNPVSSSAEGGLKLVSGRLKIGNAYGSELLALPMRATVQYYDATRWVTSTTDSLSKPGGTVTAIDVSGSALSLCEGLDFVTTPAAVTSGVGGFTLTAPTKGRCDADITLTLPSYLPSLSGRATFGIYKSPLIYRRENY